MAGFIQDPIQFVNLIADNLRDRYQSGFPVLKELVQNTDDSEAGELHFGRSPGLDTAGHPLLRGPALFFVNNGRFSASDARGIRSFGQNSKAADEASIGKFGLGMKSVFHFCEAFFFLAHDGEQPYKEVLNPWSGADAEQSLHADWDAFSDSDAQTIREHLSAVVGQTKSNPERLFILWLPLRQKAHLALSDGSRAGAIVSEYPGDDETLLEFLDEADLPVRLAALMPMLRHLKRAVYWNLNVDDSVTVPNFDVSLGDGAARLSLLQSHAQSVGAAKNASSPSPLSGRIRVIDGEAKHSMGFSGLEAYEWNPALQAMHDHELWPSSYVRDSQGHSKEAKDKARPHGTAFFSRSPGNGRLITNWSVFLPLDEIKAVETLRCEGEQDFRLTLHGYFFVDAGRQKVHGLEACDGQAIDLYDSEESLRRAWNCELLRSTVLPLLLPALDAFCDEQRLADKAKTALSDALKGSWVVKRFIAPVTEQSSWLREITPDGTFWVLRGVERKVLQLPSPPEDDTGRAWRLFPALQSITQRYWLAVQYAPSILHPSVDAQWGEEQLLDLFSSVNARELFTDAKLLDYLSSFLEGPAGPYLKALTVTRSLAALVRQGLISNGEEGLRQYEVRVRRIVSHLEPEGCFKVGNDLPRSLLRGLLSADTEALPLPARFFPPESRGAAALSVSDAARLLFKVEEALVAASDSNKDLHNAALKLSEQLIKGVPAPQRPELLQRCADLRVLGGFDCKKGRRLPLSVNEIREAEKAGVLFGSSEGTSEARRLGLAGEFQKAVPRERVLVINKETASLALNVEGAIAQCDGRAVLRSLGLQSRVLAGADERAALIGLCGVPSGDVEIRGLRFLLHADPEHFDYNDTLWVLGRKQEPVWQKLWIQLVGGEKQPWNLVDEKVADTLSRKVSDAADIHEISAQSVIDEIEKQGTSALDPSAFDRDECEQILRGVRDDSLWVSLPFHWTSQDRAVSGAAANTYLNCGDVELEADLLRGVFLIQPSVDRALAQRQTGLLKLLDEQAIIQIALQHIDIPAVWRVILDSLRVLEEKGDEPVPGLAAQLKSTPWLPNRDGDLLRPEDVIDLDVAAVEVDRVLAQEPGAFATPQSLAPELTAHPFFPNLRKDYLARERKGLEQLGLALADLDAYQIGNLNLSDAEALKESAQVLGGHSNAGWGLLASLIEKLGESDCFEALLPGMTGAVSMDRQVELLNWIANRGGSQRLVAPVFNRYLRAFAREDDASDFVQRLTLLNEESQWRASGELVSGVTGVASRHVLDEEQACILADAIFQDRPSIDPARRTEPVGFSSDTSTAGQILRDYFDVWTSRVASSLLGTLVMLFGSDKSVTQLCEELLGQHSRDWLMTRLPWESPRAERSEMRDAWLQGFTLEQAVEYFRMAVRVHDSETLRVHSILGDPINVGLEEKFSTLFVGRPSYFRLDEQDGYRVELVLRRIPTADCSDSQLSGYLRASASYLLRQVFNQRHPDIDALWDELDTSDQVDIDLAKALILDNIPFYLKQLGTHKHPALRSGLERFRDNDRREKEFSDELQKRKYRREKEKALADLQRNIETDAQAQQAILESVKRKITDYQYQAESVPFELFQNADDALRDLEFIDAYPAKPGDFEVDDLPGRVRRFVVEADGNEISFMHWGRAINQFGSKGFPGRERGYDRDLENMLILSASDKGEDVTGKFGLGFKSVWLVSDQPTIVSGRLQADIVGGLFPVANYGEPTQRLVGRLMEHQPDRRWPGTAIYLPLIDVSEDKVLDRFSGVAGAMVAFSRSIRTVEVTRRNGDRFSASWEPQQLPGCEGIEMGRICQGDGDPILVMKFSLADGALLLAVGASGFVEVPKAIPNLWVTAPIREQERLGFAINAMFEVDAGRSRLSAEVHKNQLLALRLGSQLAAALRLLRESVAERWEKVAAAMQLAPGTTPYDFWHSYWRTLMSRLPQLERESGSRVVATALLTEGLRDLAEEHQIVPNGLPGDLQRLMRWTETKTVLKGALADDDVLRSAAKAPCFQTVLDFESAVSSDLATWLRLLIPDLSKRTDRLHSVSLAGLFSRLDRANAMPAEDAEALGEVLHPSTLEQWEKEREEIPQEVVKDFKAAVEKAGDIRFLAADGSRARARQLLTPQGNEEEKRRWGFAPKSNRLAGSYGDNGVAFFRLCRGKLEAPAGRLKDWILKATNSEARQAALRYLLDGERSSQVINELHSSAGGLDGTWLSELDEDSELLSDWDSDSRYRLLYQILPTPAASRDAFQNNPPEPPEPEVEPINPEHALTDIYDWWIENRDEYMMVYRRRTYPEGDQPRLRDDDAGNFDRSSWLLLMLLGGFHTMGRVKPEQHRSFIEACRLRGWWDVFIDPRPTERFEEWMGVLDQYIDAQMDQQVFEQWMMRFPIIYKLSRHLDDYTELLIGLERVKRPFDLETALRPWADPDQQGGGIGAAALPRTLGKGANFVVRELIRLGVIDSPYLREHAYVPYQRVLRLFSEMGCPEAETTEPILRMSPVISGFLLEHMDPEKATFCGDFEIPLRIVATDPMLQQDLLGRRLSFDDFVWSS